MNDEERENEQLEEDFEVEMVDLGDLDDIGAAETRISAGDAQQQLASPAPSSSLFVSAPSSVRVSLRSRFSRRQRIVRVVFTACVVVLAGCMIVLASAPMRGALFGFFGAATPGTSTPALTSQSSPGGNTFFLEVSPSWGRATLDGHLLSYLITNGTSPFVLTRGRHTLVWLAEPFLAQHCVISFPFSGKDTCFYTQLDSALGAHAWKIAFTESLATLPIPARSSLLATAQAALNQHISTETVQPGEHYVDVTAPDKLGVATKPLQATLRFELDTSVEGQSNCTLIGPSCGFQVSDCRALCTIPQESLPVMQGWNVMVPIRAVWDYVSLDGQIIAQGQPDTLPGESDSESLVSLLIERGGGAWQISMGGTGQPFSDDLACSIAEDGLGQFLDTGRVGTPHGTFDVRFATGSSLAAGCVAVVILEPNTTTPTTGLPPTAYCFYRFGLWLAANATAHQFWPTMLQANAYERNLARKLIAE